MNLHGLGKVETYQTYLDVAFKNGIANAKQERQKTRAKTRENKSKEIEVARIKAISKSLMSSMDFVLKCFPMVDDLDPFYQELIKCTLDYPELKRSLGALNWAKKQILELLRKYRDEIRKQRDLTRMNKKRQEFSGRVSSVMKQIRKNLQYLDECRKVMRSYPSLKTSRKTVALAGAPNVGKSTILAVLTGSKPETASYPFTTKKLNLGYDSKGVQYIDTPGLLDRPISERNPIERQAILALKHLANLIVFVIDPTETCGYTIPEQRALLSEIRRRFKQEVIVVANKADKGATFKNSIEISAKEGIGIPALRKEIASLLSQTNKQE
jgi:nucleolar GTP-binding protein